MSCNFSSNGHRSWIQAYSAGASVVTIKTEQTEVDLYTAVENVIATKPLIEI